MNRSTVECSYVFGGSSANDSGFMSRQWCGVRTAYGCAYSYGEQNFSFFSGGNFSYVVKHYIEDDFL